MEEIGSAWGMGILVGADGVRFSAASRAGEYPLQGVDSVKVDSQALQRLPVRRRLLGLSAVQMSLRQTELPFVRLEQIRAVLPQELADTQVQQWQTPCFGVHCAPQASGTRVLFAALEFDQVQASIKQACAAGLEPGSVVVQELAAWPLLARKGLLPDNVTSLVIDCSVDPAALVVVRGDELLALRLAAGGEAARHAELTWLVADLLEEYGQETRLLALGDIPSEILSSYSDIDRPDLLALGIQRWDQLRGAGLAEAALSSEWSERMLNFRWGALGYQSAIKQWLKPWRTNLVVASLLLLMAGGLWGIKYDRLVSTEQRLQADLASRFSDLLPGVPMVDPVRQLQQAFGGEQQEAEQGHSLVAWIRILQVALASSDKLLISQARYDGKGVVLAGELASYAELDGVLQSLEGSALIGKAELLDAKRQASSQTVQFSIKLEN